MDDNFGGFFLSNVCFLPKNYYLCIMRFVSNTPPIATRSISAGVFLRIFCTQQPVSREVCSCEASLCVLSFV